MDKPSLVERYSSGRMAHMIDQRSTRKTAGILFLALSACYFSMSPLSVGGQGYVPEDLDSGLQMLAIFNAWIKRRTAPPMVWTRHGPITVLFDLPFIKLGKSIV